MKEARIEYYLLRRIRELGGVTAKMTIEGQRGWPDRLVCLPGGRIVLVELKRPKGGRLSPSQERLFGLLQALGIYVVMLNTYEAVDAAFRKPKENEE